ncbi:hypothetical protein LIER_30214 [Lithospermum erythrorhizon]|uniref:Uncharacterized protein n=1 Tax=Lithospermum erythrorhizon TaxID=34254 RepID=A0AAV3RPY9_LITER
MLESHGRKFNDYDLPTISEGFKNINSIPKLIMDELSISILDVDVNSVGNLNSDQLYAYKTVMEAIENEFLLRVGDGIELTLEGDLIKFPPTMLVPWESKESLSTLIDATFPKWVITCSIQVTWSQGL